MLMVLMTMAIIIVVGTSMLFVTLSSFSNSIADTQQERAYNAALVMTETLKSSSYLGKLIESNTFELEQDNPVKLKFDNGDLDDELDDFTIINGVKVYITLTNASKEKTSLDSVLVDVRGVKGSQERTVSFTYNKETTVKNVTLKDTFGNALVTNNSLGGEQKRDDLVFKRIEGDISINCWDEEVVDGKTVKKMTTRYFNPIILEGLTGSIFANGDLIIGAADNVIKVQGNIYCDGNLTIRGLDLGVNLPALFKKKYNKKYIKYSTIGNKTFAGFDILGTGEYIERELSGKVKEAMYLKYKTKSGDDDFLPLQVYDEVSHFTLMDRADENAETYTFWTKNWEKGGEVEEVTITLRVKVNGELQAVDATYNNKSGINNSQYLGATMYSTPECNPEDMIMQYPKGGNVYCSGDIIFDRVNYGYNWVYAPAALSHSFEYKYHDLAIYDSTDKGTINASNREDREKVENATVSYNKTKMRGDIFCMGRMIIAPENLALTSKSAGYKDEALVFTRMNGSNFNRYLDKDTINNQIYSNGNDFFTRLKEVFGFNGNKWNYNLNKTYNYDYTGGYRLYSNNGNIENREYYKPAENFKNENLKPFIEQLKGKDGQTYTDLKNLFKGIIKNEKDSNSGKLYNSDYILKGDGYLPGMGTGDGEHYRLHPVEFSETSNIYIYNWNYASLIENTEKKEGSEEKVKIQRQLNSTSLVQESRVDNTLDNTSVSTVNDVTYKAALTVKYQTLNVNEIYVGSGNIEAVGIDAFGYESEAGVRAKKIDTIGDMISSEYQEQSLLDIIMKIYGLNKEQALEKLKNDYWKVDDNYNAVADLSISVKDYEYKDKVFGDINRKGIILSYKVNYTTTVDYECTDVSKYVFLDTYRTVTWTKKASMPKYGYREGDNGNVHIKFTYEVEYYMHDGQFYNGKDKKVDDEKIKEVFGWDNATIERFKNNAAKFSDGLFLDLNKVAFESSIKTIVKNYVIQNTDDFPTSYETKTYNLAFPPTVGQDQEQKSITTLYDTYRMTKTTSECDTVETVLKYDSVKDTLKDFVKDVKQLALLSNSDKNSFKAISSKGDVKNMIFADKTTKVGESAFLSVRAFSDEDHGMYLRSSNARYANADKNSSVSAVFREIIDEGFAKIAILKTTKLTAELMRKNIDDGKIKVNEYNQVSEVQGDASLNPLRELKQSEFILKKLHDETGTHTIDELNKMLEKKPIDPRGITNFYDINNLANIEGSVGILGWIDKNTNNVWTYTRYQATALNSKNRFYAIYNNDSVDNNVRVLRFTNGGKNVTPLTCDNTFGLDPLYCTYDDKGNPIGGNQGGVFTNLSLTGIRTQVDYTISEDTYFNFGGEGTGGINTKLQDPVIFGASKDNGIIDSINQLNNTKRMNITIDATEKDVYVYINAPSKYKDVGSGKGSYVKNGDEYTLVGEGKGDYELQAGIEFRKCSWRVKGKHNAYIMLVGDTSINANAYKLSVNTSGGVFDNSADRSDSMLGTHFYSGFYTTYSGSYSMDKEGDSTLKLAAKEISTVESGNLCIIGTMGNQLLLGRGGYINGFVYLPNGKYVNNSTGFLGILPNAYSNNNQATIVAKDISVKGSNIGNLVFQAFDVSSSAGGAGSDIDIDYIESNEKITYTKWNFGDYYYG